jgi:hypothetical protein
MSEHGETYADALEAARTVGFRHQTGPREVSEGIDISLVDPQHLIHLRVVGEKAISVAGAHHIDRTGGKRHAETITGYASAQELADRVEAIYQATLDGSD